MSKTPRYRSITLPAAAVLLTAVAAFGGGQSAVAAPTAPAGPAAPAAPAGNATQSVIVVLRDQLTSTPATRSHVSARRATARNAQAAVLGRLTRAGGRAPTGVVHYTAANALSLTVTRAQAATLAADPSVAKVLPNNKISVPRPSTPVAVTPKLKVSSAAPSVPPGVCPTDPAKPLLEPEALTDTHTASDDPAAKTAQQLVDGSGVKVGYIADGINPDNPDFIRADGSHVITDYKAFSADGPAPEDGGAEAYGDASAIAAQGRVSHDLSTFVNAAYPLPTGCNIRVLGMSPGASIVALKTDFYDTSILQAIDYAVTVAHVDVLNESFGLNTTPDTATRSVVSLFNDMAVAAGTTVTVSSGDAGTTGTIGSPATDPKVISVAANTNSRGYLQTGYAGARYFSNGTWVNDQISSLSSGGFTQRGGTVDLTAPGESGWAVCDAGAPECTNYRAGHSDVQLFGGTSQSAPLTAGAAALVINAYRSTHKGASPRPALVKKLLTSTATDLGLPTFEQGAGLLNSRAAVEAALTYPGAKKSPPAGVSSNVVLSKSQLTISGKPGSSHTKTIRVRNVGTKKLTVVTSTRDYATIANSVKTTALAAQTDPTFPYPVTGAPWAYQKVTFTVPRGTDRLAAAMIWQGAARKVGTTAVTPVVRLTVLQPDGTFVANSRPQGGPVSANYANLDVRAPVPGTWTAIIYTLASASGYTGDVTLQTTAQRAVPVGSVSRPVLTLKPGQQKSVKVRLTIPADAGDTSQAITVASSNGHQTAVAVVERAIVSTASGRGQFRGTITGGNGRGGAPAQTLTYAFDVPKGKKDVSVGVTLANDPGDQLEGILVDPHDETQSIDSNAYTDAEGNLVGQGRTLQLSTSNPVPGRWRVVILVQTPVTGKELVQPFTGVIRFNQNKAKATGLPTSTTTKLAQGSVAHASVRVTNTGIAPVNVQLDPRTNTVRQIPLASVSGSQTFDLNDHSATPTFVAPPLTTGLTATAVSSRPAVVELLSTTQGITAAGGLSGGKNGSTVSVARVTESTGTVSTGIWYTDVNGIGPVDEAGAPPGTSRVDLFARTPEFDRAVTTSTGDFYATTVDPTADTGAPVTIQPGASAMIAVQIKPTARPGTKVHGVLNVITPPEFAYPTFNTTGDVLSQIPYAYTVGPAVASPAASTAGGCGTARVRRSPADCATPVTPGR